MCVMTCDVTHRVSMAFRTCFCVRVCVYACVCVCLCVCVCVCVAAGSRMHRSTYYQQIFTNCIYYYMNNTDIRYI